MNTRVLLYSGGMDSWCLRHLWQPDVCLYVDMGTLYADEELATLDADVVVLDAKALGQWEHANAIIPLRNLLLVTLAAQYGGNEGSVQVAMAATAGDRSLDKSPPFAHRASELLTWLWSPQWWTPGKAVDVVLPVKDLTKAELVGRYLAAGGDPQALLRSFSCYTPTLHGKPCGACKPCARRWVALACNGIQSTPDCRDYVAQHLLATARGAEDADVRRALDLGAA